MRSYALPTEPAFTTDEPKVTRRGSVPVMMRWQQYRDDWRGGKVRDLRWYGQCPVCGRNTWAFDDGENDPRGVLGDNALSVVEREDGTDVGTCFSCANEEPAYNRAMRMRGADLAPIAWPVRAT